MNGREDKKCNDLFYTCSLIEYISRKTHNHPAAVANALGKERIAKIYDLADIYHSDNIDRVSEKVPSIMFLPANMLFRLIGTSVRYIKG